MFQGDWTVLPAALLLVGLCVVAIGDWRRRTIPNWLTAAIALGAPIYWWAAGLDLWPGVALQLALGVVVFGVFAAFFAMGAMGGGDVKLLAALSLWFSLVDFFALLTVMAIAGGVLTVVMVMRHRWLRAEGRVEVPYGIAIAFAGVWSLSRTVF